MRVPQRYVKLESQGHVLRVERPEQPRSGGGARGVVRGFSDASRRRLLEKLGRLDIAPGKAIFITVTYADTWPDDNGTRADLDALFKRIRRRYPRAALIWRLERQQRGAPHLHMIVLGVPYLPVARLRDLWASVIDYKGAKRLQVSIERIRTWRGVIGYAAKYIAKRSGGDGGEAPPLLDNGTYRAVASETSGRVWGILGADALPWAPLRALQLAFGPWFMGLKEEAGSQWAPAGEGDGGFMLYDDRPGRWLDLALLLARGQTVCYAGCAAGG